MHEDMVKVQDDTANARGYGDTANSQLMHEDMVKVQDDTTNARGYGESTG